MRFSVFIPPQANEDVKVPTIYWLSGLTCTDDNFTQKACAQHAAAKFGICSEYCMRFPACLPLFLALQSFLSVVAPDTSPRGAGIEGEEDGWDFGTGTEGNRRDCRRF